MLNQGWCYQDQIKSADTGLTVLQYYAQKYLHSSLAEWEDRITQGQVLLNNQRTTSTTALQLGQRLTYHRPPWEEPPVPLRFDILHEDEALLVIAKPAGLPVLPGGGFLENTLLWQLQQRYPQDKVAPIHRLGRGTSGVMLIAKTSPARAHLSQQMRQHQITKVYRALVGASDLPNRFSITQPIGKLPHPLLGYIYGAVNEGLSAQSDVVVVARSPTTTLLEVTILTGRPHQIRIHLAAAGYPLLGDPLYAVGGILRQPAAGESVAVPGDCGYHLHAYQVSFVHPSKETKLHITASPPHPLWRIENE